ncbi:hypothetical protein N836_12975 [Leptolyngbya sp. Heron Island J]|uniref:DUF928 domain-containing protein n=1 Tax=Leptolyngbya sp. Heron Island J TaxID=1385935 RepID=UPI0003B93C7F|nr:DUF928 domain-containing protein [Leptolyngbya sp. Heron Island J]ESA35284.1 hypothetical protein N836_12975 [Leptolyngbya sp. Heron Island J]
MRSRNHSALISFTLTALLSQLGSIPVASAIPTHPIDHDHDQKSDDLPNPPTTPIPDGNRTPGGSLSGDQAVCPPRAQQLTAITPISAQGKTLSGHPTFWFYVPYTAAEVQEGEFSILTQNEDERIYKTLFQLPAEPGFVSITLPMDEVSSLQEGQYYHWYLNLSCASTVEAQTDLNIDGWVQRVASTSEVDAQASDASSDIWYDLVDNLAAQLQAVSGNNVELEQSWVELLEAVELEALTQEPVIGPVKLIDR